MTNAKDLQVTAAQAEAVLYFNWLANKRGARPASPGIRALTNACDKGLLHADWVELPNGATVRRYTVTERGTALIEKLSHTDPAFKSAMESA